MLDERRIGPRKRLPCDEVPHRHVMRGQILLAEVVAEVLHEHRVHAQLVRQRDLARQAGIVFLRCLPNPRRLRTRGEEMPLRETLGAPLRDANYRRLLHFSAAWSFTSGFMAPFYTVYMLRELRLSFFPPLVVAQVVAGFGWSAFHVSLSNLTLKLAPEESRPSYLATFGASSGLAEGIRRPSHPGDGPLSDDGCQLAGEAHLRAHLHAPRPAGRPDRAGIPARCRGHLRP